MLASIGVPLVLNALTGEGLHVDRNRPTKSLPVYILDTPKSKGGAHLMYPFIPAPFIGSWPKTTVGQGKKRSRKQGDRLLTSLLGIPQTEGWNRIPVLGKLI